MLLRIYGRTHGEQALETVLTDTVVFTLLSERKLGPKLHGIFPGGRIEQYIPVSICVCNCIVCKENIGFQTTTKINSLKVHLSMKFMFSFSFVSWLNQLYVYIVFLVKLWTFV